MQPKKMFGSLGCKGYRTRLWKLELQEFSDEIGLILKICHFPPERSKWNKIEHKVIFPK